MDIYCLIGGLERQLTLLWITNGLFGARARVHPRSVYLAKSLFVVYRSVKLLTMVVSVSFAVSFFVCMYFYNASEIRLCHLMTSVWLSHTNHDKNELS